MLKPPVPPDEAARLATLRELKLLDTPAEERFDRITRMASRLFDVPIALISLVDADRQWFKSCVGVSVTETPREISFCAHAIMSSEIFYVPDTQKDERFFDNPLVTGEPFIRFYAGYPLSGPDGRKIATLCIVDHRPRDLSAEEFGLLRDLGQWAEMELSAIQFLRNELDHYKEKLARIEQTSFEFLEGLPVGVFVLDAAGNPYYANQTAQQLLGKGIAPGASPQDLAEIYRVFIAGTDQPYPTERLAIVRALAGKSTFHEDVEIRKANEVLQVQVWATPIFHKGKVAYAIAAFQDITERKRTERRLAAQHAVTRVLGEAETVADATPGILQAICESVGWQVAAIWTTDEAASVLRCVDVWHAPDAEVGDFENLTRKFMMPAGVGLPGRVWTMSEPVWIEDIVEDANFPRTPAALKNGLHAACAFPILFGRKVTGVVEFFNRRIFKPDAELLSMMASLGSQIGQFMARKQTEEALRTSQARLQLISGGQA